MSSDPEKLISLFLNCSESMSDGEMAELCQWIKEDRLHARRFVRAVQTQKSIREILSKLDLQMQVGQADSRSFCHNSRYEEEFWKELADAEINAPACPLPPPAGTKLPETIRIAKVERSVRKINRFAMWTAIGSIAAVLMLLLYIVCGPQPSEQVATLVDAINIQWPSSGDYAAGHRFETNAEPVYLPGGIIKLLTDRRVEVLIEGPAQFAFLNTSEIELSYGRLFARVAPEGYGFSVNTPTGKVIDLGTEFAVEADIRGDTELHVFTGKTNLFATGEHKTSQVVEEGHARRVSIHDPGIRDIHLRQNAFVRQIDSKQNIVWRGQNSVNLADIVGGGNGFGTGRIGYGIDPLGNRPAAFNFDLAVARAGDNTYTETRWNRFIDGVFVPDGGPGAVQISSTGLRFADCPDTNNLFWSIIQNGGYVRDWDQAPLEPLRLAGRAYGDADNPVIFMHSNLGITFDLKAIRSELQTPQLLEFRTVCGISEYNPNRVPYADFFVLIDGQIRFSRTGVKPGQAHRIAIPIELEDRFLTLVTTDGGEEVSLKIDDGGSYTIDCDWCLFAEPMLTLKSNN